MLNWRFNLQIIIVLLVLMAATTAHASPPSVSTTEAPVKEYYSNGKIKGIWFPDPVVTNDPDIFYEGYHQNGAVKHQVVNQGRKKMIRGFTPDGRLHWEAPFIKGHIQGEVRVYNSDGNVHSIWNYKKGKRHKEGVEYYENGQTKTIYLFHEGLLNGLTQEYDRAGNLSAQWLFHEGVLHGTSIGFYPSGRERFVLKANLGEGTLVEAFETGEKKGEWPVVDNHLHGLVKRYHPNGKEAMHAQIELEQLNGVYKEFHENGKPKITSRFTSGKLDGPVQRYHLSGSLFCETNYQEGMQIKNQIKYFYDGGKIQAERNYFKGFLHGRQLDYYESGVLKKDQNYTRGWPAGVKLYNEGGKLTEVHAKARGSNLQLRKTFFRNQRVHTEARYSKDMPQGLYREFNEEGEVVAQRSYHQGVLDGKVYEFISSKGVRLSCTFRGGRPVTACQLADQEGNALHGNVTLRDSQGRIRRKQSVDHGIPEGYFETYYLSGTRKSEGIYRAGLLDETYRTYYESGNIREEHFYNKGVLHGDYRVYYESGKVREKGAYVEGFRHGEVVSLDEHGNVLEVRQYAYGNLQKTNEKYFVCEPPKVQIS